MKTKTRTNIAFLCGLLVIPTLFFFITKNILTNKPATLADLVPVNKEKVRFFDESKRPDNINGYPNTFYTLLTDIPESRLMQLRCSETFIRNWEALFFLRNSTNLKYSISLKHEQMNTLFSALELQLPDAYKHDKKFLLGRLCLSKNIQILEYNRGVQPQFYDNFVALGNNIDTFLFVTQNQKTRIIQLTDTQAGPYFHCTPMQLTTSGILYYQCSQISEGSAVSWFYEIDLNTGNRTLNDTCTYTYRPKPLRKCNRG